jgi:nucleotide-binding universal stress UspA family protein
MLKMLVAVDGSRHSDHVVEYMIKRSGWFKEPVELHLLNVQPPMPYGSTVTSVLGHDAVDKYHRDEAMKVLTPIMQKLDAAGVAYRHHICVGDAAELIVQFAKEQGCDQIVVGTRGSGTTANLLLGSVASRVIHLSDIPVLLVK